MQDSKHFTISTSSAASAPMTATTLSWVDTRLLCTASLYSDIHLQTAKYHHYTLWEMWLQILPTLSHKQGSLMAAHHSTGYWQLLFIKRIRVIKNETLIQVKTRTNFPFWL
jgi:hypothetical protein